MIAYIGPESIAPVTSVFVAIAGFLLIGWRWITTRVKRIVRFVFRLPPPEPTEEELDATDPARETS